MTHLGVVVRPPIASSQIITSTSIEIATQSAQLTVFVLRRHGHLQEVIAIPFNGQSQLSAQHDAALGESLNAHIVAVSCATAAVLRIG